MFLLLIKHKINFSVSDFLNSLNSSFLSRKMNNNNPVPLQIQKPQFSGDVVEGFTYMSVGDSAIFTVAIDSIKKRGAQLAPWMKDGMMLEYYVQMVSIKSEAQTKADNEKKSSAQKTIDATLIEDYLKKNNIAAQKSASGLNYVITKCSKNWSWISNNWIRRSWNRNWNNFCIFSF